MTEKILTTHHLKISVLLGQILTPLLASCTEPFPPRTLIDGLSILAVKAEPPEIGPGGEATLTALAVDGSGFPNLLHLWAACTPDPDDIYGYGCSEFGYENIIGMEESAIYTAPSEGVEGSAILNLAVLYEEDFQEIAGELTAENFDDILPYLRISIKRVVISENPDHNRNPVIESLEVSAMNGNPLESIEPDSTYTVRVKLGEGGAESYLYRNSSGNLELRTEEPYISWFSSSGEFSSPFSPLEGDDASVEWYSGLEEDYTPGTANLYAVVRDRRGGCDWATLTLEVM